MTYVLVVGSLHVVDVQACDPLIRIEMRRFLEVSEKMVRVCLGSGHEAWHGCEPRVVEDDRREHLVFATAVLEYGTCDIVSFLEC